MSCHINAKLWSSVDSTTLDIANSPFKHILFFLTGSSTSAGVAFMSPPQPAPLSWSPGDQFCRTISTSLLTGCRYQVEVVEEWHDSESGLVGGLGSQIWIAPQLLDR